MKPEQKKEQRLSDEDLKQTAGGQKIPHSPLRELSKNDLEEVSGGAVKKGPPKVIDE